MTLATMIEAVRSIVHTTLTVGGGLNDFRRGAVLS
ncbi:hypothetical protein SPRA44_400025 [Serratia proteamaculans]|nr:hypothetical protein SPRA44_400025 [Serratia proteamaculans]